MRTKSMLTFFFGAVLLAACAKSGYEGASPDFELEPEVLRFVARPGEIVESQNVQLQEAHGLLHPWRAIAAQPWIIVSPAHGEGPGQVSIAVRSDGLAPGRYRSELSFVPELSEDGGGRAELVVELEILEAGWQALGGPYAGDMRALAWDPSNPDRILVGGKDQHLFLSDDGGQHFIEIALETIGADCDPHISQILMLESGRAYLSVYQSDQNRGGVYRSDDGGTSWRPSALVNLKIGSLAALDDDILLAEGDGLWRSEDGGASWTELTPPGLTHFVKTLPFQTTRAGGSSGAIAGADDGLLYLYDGSDFASRDSGLGEPVGDFATTETGTWFARGRLNSNEVPRLRWSDDAGQSWQDCGAAGRPSHLYGYSYRMFASGDELFIAARELYRSRDGCQSFQLIDSSGLPRFNDRAGYAGGAAHPDGPLLLNRTTGLLRMEPETDSLVQLPLFDFSVRALHFHVSSQRLLAVTSLGGPFAMDAQGRVEGLGGAGLSSDRFASFTVDPRSSQFMLAGSPGDGLYATRDGGQSWQRDLIGTTYLYAAQDIGRAPDDPDLLWVAGSYQGLWTSADGGQSFTRLLADVQVTRVVPLTGRRALINLDGLQLVDLDTATLQVLRDGSSPSLLARTADGSIFIGDDSYNLQRSTDEGASFVELPFGSGQNPRAVAVDSDDPQRIWLGYDAGLFESRDGGQTFGELHAPFPVTALAFDAEGGRLFVGTSGGGVFLYLPQP